MVPARARSRHRAGPAGGHRRGAGSPAAQQAGTLEAARPAAPRLALLILAAALVVVGLVFLVPGERLSQGYDWFQIWAYHKEFIRSSILQDGTVPLWCRWSFSGKPFLADVESQLLYPGTLLHVLLPSRLALPLDVLVHFALAGLGMHLFCRSRGMHPWAGLFAGVAFLACGFNIAHTTVGHIHYYAAVAWMPFVFLAVEKWLEGGRAVWIALGALSVGVQFLAGALQVSWMTIVFGGLYGGGRVLEKAWASRAPDGAARGGSSPGAGWTRARPLRAVALGLAGVGAIFALGLAVAGAQLLPTRELASLSLREGRGYEFATLDSMPPGVASHLLAPGRLGGAVEWEFYGYFGIAAIGLAAAALGARLFRRGGAVFALLALLAALMMLGDATPFFRVLYALVPGLSLFRAHAREVLVVSFSVICMAASGVDAALGGMGR